MPITNPPKDHNFCSKCGAAMQINFHADAYNITTGKPIRRPFWECRTGNRYYEHDSILLEHEDDLPFKGALK